MTRWIPASVVAIVVLGSTSTYAQVTRRDPPPGHTPFPAGTIEGQVFDESHSPVIGAMVSVVGRTTAAATTDRSGRYTLRELPYGPYILSVHSRGFYKSHGRTIQLVTSKVSVPEIQLARAGKAPIAADGTVADTAPPVAPTQLAGFGADTDVPATVATSGDRTPAASSEDGETAWRLRHLPRSILKDVESAAWTVSEPDESDRWTRLSTGALVPLAFFSELPFSGQLNLMTIDSFDHPSEMFSMHAPRSVAYVSVNTRAAGGAWSMQGAMTQGDLSSWIVAGSYKSIASPSHAYELGLSYSTQRYDGGNAEALGAIRDSARNVGLVYGHDEWTLSPRLVLGYGTQFARYDYIGGSGVWSPHVGLTIPLDGFRIKALVSRRSLVPGAEEFAPSVTGMWLPPERTFSSLAPDGRFTVEQAQHLQVALERDLAAGVTVAVRAFDQRIDNQLLEIFDMAPGGTEAPLGHYYVANGGDFDAQGWGVAMIQEVSGYLRARIEYTVSRARWDEASDLTVMRAVRSESTALSDRVHDLLTSIEATIPQTATRVAAKYRVNSAFWAPPPVALMGSTSNARFNVRVNQSLPFLRFSNADWEALVDIRNMFREVDAESSIYDEAFAIRAPKRIVGGLQVRF